MLMGQNFDKSLKFFNQIFLPNIWKSFTKAFQLYILSKVKFLIALNSVDTSWKFNF